MANGKDLISPNFEICSHQSGKWILEFPSHIERDHEHDPFLDFGNIIELRYLLDEVIKGEMQIL